MDPETPKEVAKATGELAKLGTKALEILEKFIGAPAEQFGGVIADELAFFRLKRRMRMKQVLEEAAKQLEERGKEPEPVPTRILLPIIEKSSIEDDDLLIQTWATLLANASDKNTATSVHPRYVAILGELTAEEVNILEHNFHNISRGPMVGQHVSFPNVDTTNYARYLLIADHFVHLGIAERRLKVSFPRKQITAKAQELPGRSRTIDSKVEVSRDAYLTSSGVEFLLACHKPKQ